MTEQQICILKGWYKVFAVQSSRGNVLPLVIRREEACVHSLAVLQLVNAFFLFKRSETSVDVI